MSRVSLGACFAFLVCVGMAGFAHAEESGMKLIAVDGMPISGSTESLAGSSYSGPVAVNRSGRVAFVFDVEDESGYVQDPALWLNADGSNVMLTAPDWSTTQPLAPDFLPQIFNTQYDNVALTDTDMVVALVQNDGTNGLWGLQLQLAPSLDATVVPIAVVGGPAPTGGTWAAVGENISGTNDVGFKVNTHGSIVFFARDGAGDGLFLRKDGVASVVATEGMAAAGMSGEVFASFNLAEFFLDDSDVVRFRTGEAPIVIWSYAAGGLSLLVAPVSEQDAVAGDIISLMGTMDVGPTGVMGFNAYRKDLDAQGGEVTRNTVYLMESGGAPVELLDDQIQVEGTTLFWLDQIAVYDRHAVAIIADFVPDSGGNSVSTLATVDVMGGVQVLAAVGDAALGGGVYEAFEEIAYSPDGVLHVLATSSAHPGDRMALRMGSNGLERALTPGDIVTDAAGTEYVVDDMAFYGRNPHGHILGGNGIFCLAVFLDGVTGAGIACEGLADDQGGADEILVSGEVAAGGPVTIERALGEAERVDFTFTLFLGTRVHDAPEWTLQADFSEPVVPVGLRVNGTSADIPCELEVGADGLATGVYCNVVSMAAWVLSLEQPLRIDVEVGVRSAGYASDELTLTADASGLNAQGQHLGSTPATVTAAAPVADLSVEIDPLVAAVPGYDEPPDAAFRVCNYGPRPTAGQVELLFVGAMGFMETEEMETLGVHCVDHVDVVERCVLPDGLDVDQCVAIPVELWPDAGTKYHAGLVRDETLETRDPDESNNYHMLENDDVDPSDLGGGSSGLCAYAAGSGRGSSLAIPWMVLLVVIALRRGRRKG